MSKAGKRRGHVDADERSETDHESSALAKEGKAAVAEIKNQIAVEALRIIHEIMPQKILELTKEISENENFKYPTGDDDVLIEFDSDAAVNKKRKMDDRTCEENGSASSAGQGCVKSDQVVECNQIIFRQQTLLKGEIQQCLSMLVKVKVWIQLNIPKVEDGNNFGVGVQEETVNELSRAEDACFNSLESMNKYLFARGKLISRFLKYPGIQDYRLSVRDLDRKERAALCVSLTDLRNSYFTIHDSICKNLDKIKLPRSATAMPFS
mmetsp:Transcript_6306/g.20165  ORF Transcript_6306/g.20165 Transcript_6306/m.20165 type:complete len:266 (-) Transcript_6306:129-926(-)|eukprot:CAMPEP_0113694666 /NCGR_PEP_ID=MMETSP0038_2-20120614/20434_1 /TAXON_ID=2898 /ORGANISM="Cryptomonas paramecium" /LENGTH=265 /DNA_ID=CAMNT_0000617049 /DNA_START=13 /DNA_END=810 /DNA_ORIENTATION=+ /assembly_acc=CAM_ASM_000170